MLLDVEIGLPGINIQFVKSDDHGISLLCHIDTCTAMYKGKIVLHQ